MIHATDTESDEKYHLPGAISPQEENGGPGAVKKSFISKAPNLVQPLSDTPEYGGDPPMNNTGIPNALSILSENRQGVLRDVAFVMARHGANILTTQQSVISSENQNDISTLYFEFEGIADMDALIHDLSEIAEVHSVERHRPFSEIYGKRVIILGGGAQVAQVALGAVNEADRHNIRGERISVDTIPLVGEDDLAAAAEAVSRLPRATVLVLAGSIMGGKITESVMKIQKLGIPVICLSMVGSVPDHADLVVTDPIQAGVFAVMHVSSKAVFNIYRVQGRKF
ncbi:DUF5612 domain-containing protein [Methanogenium cariaci]|jgi:energy-converting hydrogenase B subunit Q